jgi:hypothetical protein
MTIGYKKKTAKKMTVGRTKYSPHRCRRAMNDGVEGLRAAIGTNVDYL